MAYIEDGAEIMERKLFASFSKFDEFTKLQTTFLTVDLTRDPTDDEADEEQKLFSRLLLIVRTLRAPHLYSSVTSFLLSWMNTKSSHICWTLFSNSW